MSESIDTGFRDKTGRTIYVGDIVQSRLGAFGKSGGPKDMKVIVFGKHFHLVSEFETDVKYGGIELKKATAEHLVIIRSESYIL